MVNLAKIFTCYLLRKHQYLHELARSLHRYQETKSWQDNQEILTMTWQDILSCQNYKAPLNKIYRELV